MHRVRLVHWKPEEAQPRVEQLRQAGFEVEFEPVNPEALRSFATDPPDAFAIDLTRLPSHGRDVAIYLRERKATRRVPIVFLGGASGHRRKPGRHHPVHQRAGPLGELRP